MNHDNGENSIKQQSVFNFTNQSCSKSNSNNSNFDSKEDLDDSNLKFIDNSFKSLDLSEKNVTHGEDILTRLPIFVAIEIFSYLNFYENIDCCVVSKLFYKLLSHDSIWKQYYNSWFIYSSNNDNSNDLINKYKTLFKFKILNPCINDRIQVYWIGQFVLAHNGPYYGKAWWNATITAVDRPRNSFLVRYDGWYNNWDEWVDRSHIRWPKNNHLSNYLRNQEITANESVELEIKGRLCIAYLECKIYKIIINENNNINYIIKDAIIGKDIIVERNVIHLTRLPCIEY